MEKVSRPKSSPEAPLNFAVHEIRYPQLQKPAPLCYEDLVASDYGAALVAVSEPLGHVSLHDPPPLTVGVVETVDEVANDEETLDLNYREKLSRKNE